jgi:hypothetical protein
MQQSRSSGKVHASFGSRIVVFLCLAALLFFCLMPAILMSIAAFPSMFDGDAKDAKNRKELQQLSEALMNFQTKFSVDYIPSRIRLLDSGEYDLTLNENGAPNNQLDFDSYQYLLRLWPRLQFPVDWNNNGKKDDDALLEGDQCLVFFTGGIQSNKDAKCECIGFSKDGKNPAKEGGDRFSPFCQFKTSRLSARSNGFFVYLDAYGKTPYAYFSSYKVRNGYNRYGKSDCTSIPDGPYHDGKGNYYNPESFQIISAGADGKFGRGGKWIPANAKDIDPVGRDDVSNFHSNLLGKP